MGIDEVARRVNKDVSVVRQWEDGTLSPTYPVLEDLAYKLFKVPIAVFYFPQPPDVDDPTKTFRHLPDYELARLSPDTLHKIRLAQGYQDSLKELTPHYLPAEAEWASVTISGRTPEALARDIRKRLGISLPDQFSYRDAEAAAKAWRHAIELFGVFAFKDTLKDRFISGFCIISRIHPVIFVNNSTSFTRQVFTLAHELGHILFGVSGVTDIDESYFRLLSPRYQTIERKCNRFAAELLVPDSALRKLISSSVDVSSKAMSELADAFSVSREVILRRFLDRALVSQQDYAERSREWNDDYLRNSSDTTGGDYYRTRMAYLGEGFTQLAFANYRDGRLSKTELAEHLNIKTRFVDKLEGRLGR